MNDTPFDDLIPSHNRKAGEKHRREVMWQITFPLALIGLAALVGAGFLIGGAVNGYATGPWRDAALIWILLLSMIAALIPLAILAGLVFGVIRLIGLVPKWAFMLQQFVERITAAANGISRAVTGPLVRLNSLSAGLGRLLGRGPGRN